jgi:hypothetical protein
MADQLTATIQLTPEELRVLHNAYTFLYEYRRRFDKLNLPDDSYLTALFQPKSETDLHTLNKLRLRSMVAMNETWQALPDDAPEIDEYFDKAELWVPFEHEIEQINAILND